MTTTTIEKTKNVKPEQFVSPLQSYINENCVGGKCPRWQQLLALKAKTGGLLGANVEFGCNTMTETGTDQMFLCMTAKGLQMAETDPAKILQDAMTAISESEQ